MKFYANTELLNWKQVLKFQQNRSTSATATASLVRSLRSTIGRGVIDCQVCVRANGKTPAHLKSVFKMFTVSSRTPARRCGCHCLTSSSMTTCWKCYHSSIRRDFSWSTSRGCGTHDPAAFTKSGSRLG